MIHPFNSNFTVDAASLTRFLSNATGLTWTLTETTTVDGLAHQVTIRNDSATDHSGKTAVLTGTDFLGNALTETLALPGTSATVTSTKYFKTLTSVVPSATIGADTMDIGIAATARAWVLCSPDQETTVAVIASGTINFDVLVALDVPGGDSLALPHASFTGKTASIVGSIGFPVQAVAVDVNSHTSGVFSLQVLQGER